MPIRKNKIDVAVDVLADSSAKLEKFNRDFGNTVTRLEKMLQSGGLGGQGTGGGQGSYGAGHMFDHVAPARQGGQISQIPQGWESQATPLLNKGGPSIAGESGFEQDYIEATKRIGEGVPTSLRQALGYYGSGQLELNPLNPFYTDPEKSGFNDLITQRGYSLSQLRDKQYRQNVATRANSALFNLQATKALAMNAMGKYTGFFGQVQAIGNSGYDVNANASRSGILGGMLGSGAFFHGLSENIWQPAISSAFGLNPSYGFGQAQAARQAINSYGWGSGNEGNWLANVLKQNTVNYGLDPQSQMAFLDPMLRWGGQSFQNLNAVLTQIPQAATAAGYNLKQFTQELVAASTQIAQQTGIPIGVAANTINAISATTGLSPSQAGQLDNINNALQAAGMTGTKPWDVMNGTQGQALLAPALKRYSLVLGANGFSSMQQFEKSYYHPKTQAEYEQAKKALFMMQRYYAADPSAVGNIQPIQAIHMISQAGSTKGLLNQTHILDQLGDPGSLEIGIHGTPQQRMAMINARIEHLLRSYYPGNKSRTEHILSEYMSRAPHQRTPQDLFAMAKGLLEAYQPHDRRKTAQQTIGLTPEAKKLVTLMQNDAAHANAGGVTGFARSAGGVIGGVIHGDWGHAGTSLENLGSGLLSDVNPF